MLPKIKITKNYKKETILEFDWSVITLIQKLFHRFLFSKTVWIGVVGGTGVFCGIIMAIALFSTQPVLYAEVKSDDKKLVSINKIIFPTTGFQFQVRSNNRIAETVVYFPAHSRQAEVLDTLETGTQAVAIKENNGIYYYSLFEIRTIQHPEMQAFLKNQEGSLVIYTPTDILQRSYRVFTFKK